jgi:hypothetical protein
MENYLEKYDEARSAIEQAWSIDELSAIVDQATLLKEAARVAGNHEGEQQMVEIRLRAERRFGEVSKGLDKGKPGPNNYVNVIDTTNKESILNSVGVSRQTANQYEKLADIEEPAFEKALSDFRKEGELSRAKLLTTVKKEVNKPQQITLDITARKHPNQVLYEQLLDDIKNMTSIEEVINFINKLIKTYE